MLDHKITLKNHVKLGINKDKLFFTPIRVDTIFKNPENNKCWQGCREIGPSYIAGGNVK